MNELQPKRVSESAVEDYVYRVFPNDLNPNDTVFGGLVMSTLDRLASVVAERHTGRLCVTASVDSLHFLAPARKGEILIFKAAINRTWRTSMEIGAKVIAENTSLGIKRHIVSAYFTFVAVNENQVPVEVPKIIPETTIEKRRYAEAELRKQHRRAEMDQQKARRALEQADEE
jgi:acyl-CoA hydrolase